MFDLSSKGKLFIYPIKLADKSILHLRVPTQKMLRRIIEMQEIMDSNNMVDAFDSIFQLTTDIFNNNTDKKTFAQEDIEEMLNIQMCLEVMKDYLDKTLPKLGE